jgi:flavin reductase (DIM6/NTAB) family NADH-FMN oxidoreductase RutF/DNA-binding MarR family transcriptional regulator
MDFPLDLAGALGRRVQPYSMSTKEHSSEGKAHFDRRAFRNALGRFPTGVTVVTTLTPDGAPIGLTANSFSSVSLDPPLVLWSLAKSASTLPIFLKAPHYAINVLAADQIALSRQFASVRGDRFKGVKCRLGLGGVPIIEGCTAWFECHNVARHEGGDHIILVGEVERFAEADRRSLAFHVGGYHVTAHHPESLPQPDGRRFIDDYLLYLLARASHLASGQFHALLKFRKIPVSHWRVLAALSAGEAMTISALARIVLFKQPTLTKAIDRMALLALVRRSASATDRRQVLVRITGEGRRLVRGLLNRAKKHESDVLAACKAGEAAQLKAALRALIDQLGDVE